MMPHLKLSGIIPPMITPLNPDFSLDKENTENLLDHLIKGGVHGVFILGTTGEFSGLSTQVKEELITLTCKKVGNQIPVLVGITHCAWDESIHLAKLASNLGATALVAAPPFYMNIGQSELEDYYLKLADTIDLPLLLYNMPSHTGIVIEVLTVKSLSEHPNIIGIKDSGGDLSYFKDLCHKFEGQQKFRIFVGPEEILAPTLKMGGHGGVTGGANLFPEFYVEAFGAFEQKDEKRLGELQDCIGFLSEQLYENATYKSSYLKGLKAAMSLEGLCNGVLAPPLSAYTKEESDEIQVRLERVKERVNQVLSSSKA